MAPRKSSKLQLLNYGGLSDALHIPAGFRSFLRIPVDSGGIKFGRDISQIYNSGGCKFQWNYFIPELAPECSPEFTGTECNWNPVPGVFIN